MGATISHCAEAVNPTDQAAALLPPAAAAAVTPAAPAPAPKVNYMDLPCPVKYEELQREALMSLKPELFEGCRFDFTRPLNQKFSLQHSLFMGSVEVPSQSSQTFKVPAASYEFGANLIDQKGMIIGRLLTDGRMNARIRYDLNDMLSFKMMTQLAEEKSFSQVMFDLDGKGLDWQGQIKLGNGAFYGVNYLQSVTPTLALGGEAFWLGSQRKSGVGFAARHASSSCVATAQIATTGLLSATYVQKVSDKVSLATEFLWNWNSREAQASVGYDYFLRQCRLRGRIDSAGVVAAYLEERVNVGVTFLLSAEIDHSKKDYKFGFGMTLGE
uniref:Mitochondrial import receptor subunit TOM40 n=1 Tax=Pyramimonas obovata TaxID=1411642 RepID=A0A7S0N468_9CHLO|eukprot:CAMPEP_0118923116 /NCGR_PEP_ID=MMETSP1169-20130426/1763_1 /TAXON_ID=36882 /ORGANISM="Pyramimonas obovata, Strain CCMP722" /LENGTH=327 /DNA_ID=CAMNT_0006864061 /DNA_START=60 /DNA_END=1043 /DNA_ORIENTATION=-